MAAADLLPSERRPRILLKLAAGIILLALLVAFSLRYGDIIRGITFGQIAMATVISIFILLLNGAVGYRSLTLVAGKIKLLDAITVTAISSFANALGGLPIGMVYKFHVFRKKSELPAASVVTGLVYFTLLNVSMLLGIAALLGPWKPLLAPLLLSVLLPLVPGLHRAPGLRSLNWRTHCMNLLLSLAVSMTMVLCYLVLLDRDCNDLACYETESATIATGLALNFLMNGQSLGGASELVMGFAGYLHGAGLLRGVELAIIIRLSTLLAASLLLGILKLKYGKNHLF